MHKNAKKPTKQDDAVKSPEASPLLFAIKEEELPEVHTWIALYRAPSQRHGPNHANVLS